MSEDKLEIMSDDKKEIMSCQREVTPNLQRYLDENDLSQYSDDFIRLGYLSTDKICCLPGEMDANFVEELNINSNIHCLKARTMLNEIRREDANNSLSKMFNVSNTNNINDNKTDVIDLISPEPIVENDMNENNDNNQNTNKINSTNQHKKYFLELLSKYGTKMEYDIDEKVGFFIPDFIPEKYIDRIGIIKSKISDMEYIIIDEKSQIPYNVPLEFILKLNENNNINIKSYLLTYWIEGYYADWWAIGGIIQNISNNGQIRSTLPFRITQQYDAIIQMHNNFNVISMNVFPNYCCYLIASCSYYEPNNSIRLNVINNKGINVFGEGKDIIIADPTDTSYYLYQMIELKMLNNNQNGYKYFMVAYANHVNNNTTIAAKVLYLHYINNQFTLSVVNQTFIFTDINDPNYLDSFCMYILDDFQSIIMAWGVINNDKITKRPVSTSINAKIWNFSLST
eukprot:263346_1